MAITRIAFRGIPEVSLVEFVCDTNEDVSTLPTDVAPGSIAKVIVDADHEGMTTQYIMNNKGEWKYFQLA